MPKRSRQVKVYLTTDQHDWLRRAAFDRRTSHSDLVEQALDALRRRLDRADRREVGSGAGAARDRASA